MARRLAFATQLKYKHNDMEALEKELQKCEPDAVKLIVVDGVFSMEGDLANLPEIVRLKKYNASIYVDEAHGLGVFGKQGRGVRPFRCYRRCRPDYGYIQQVIGFHRWFCCWRQGGNQLAAPQCPFLYSRQVAHLLLRLQPWALHIIKSEPERIQRLWDITNYALKKFRDAGFEIGETESLSFLSMCVIEKTFIVTKLAFDEGIFINPVIPPACAPQDTLVRVALMATHTVEQVDYAVEKLTKCFKNWVSSSKLDLNRYSENRLIMIRRFFYRQEK